jgi:hypothetical protein
VKGQLGADEVVDYTSSDFAELYSAPGKQLDIVVDCLVRWRSMQASTEAEPPQPHMQGCTCKQAGTTRACVARPLLQQQGNLHPLFTRPSMSHA